MVEVFTSTWTLVDHYTTKVDVSLPTSPETTNELPIHPQEGAGLVRLFPQQQGAFVF